MQEPAFVAITRNAEATVYVVRVVGAEGLSEFVDETEAGALAERLRTEAERGPVRARIRNGRVGWFARHDDEAQAKDAVASVLGVAGPEDRC